MINGQPIHSWKEMLNKHETLHNGNCYCDTSEGCKSKLKSFISQVESESYKRGYEDASKSGSKDGFKY